MRYIIAVVIAGMGLTACASQDKWRFSSFEPSGRAFRFEAMKSRAYDEEVRRQWLVSYLTDNDMCPKTYLIDQRKIILVEKTFLGDIEREIIHGHCPE